MVVNDSDRIILGSKRYASAPNTLLSTILSLSQNQKEIIEFDRNVDISLQETFNEERQISTTFRPTGKFYLVFKNSYTGKTSYTPFRNNLYYTNAVQNAVASFPPPVPFNSPILWEGFPQFFEFDFIRLDNNVPGYTQPPNNHLTFVNKSASTYNWTHYLSYAYDNDFNKQLYTVDPNSLVSWSWQVQDGIPFVITVGNNDLTRVIRFKCPMKHGLTEGEFVELSFSYNGNNLFQVSSLGDPNFGSDEYIFNITNVGFVGLTFNSGNIGLFKRVINNQNISETKSIYYVRRHKILTNVEDSVLMNAGFEKNIYGDKTKTEEAVLTPNNQTRTSVLEGSQSYTLSFNTDLDTSPFRDNQKRPITEIFFTTIWKGYFGWTKNLKQGYKFNLPLINNSPNPWWDTFNPFSNSNLNTGTYNSSTLPSAGPFIYTENLKRGDIIDGDVCEWNNYDQKERVVSTLFHKINFNTNWFSLMNMGPKTNQFGYYYQPHQTLTLKTYSTYIEEGFTNDIVNMPDYAYYSNLSDGFRWRDIYPYGFIDNEGVGVDYPFMNGKHYPFKDIIFRIIPEGTNVDNLDVISDPIIDECE